MSNPSHLEVAVELERAFERADDRLGSRVRTVTIGTRRVELRFVGAALEAVLMRALAHLESSAGEPLLRICVADSESSGVSPRLEFRAMGAREAADGGDRCIYVPGSHAIYHLSASRRMAFCWFASARIEPWDVAAPFRQIFSWWAEALGAQLAHAAVVGKKDAGVVLAGPSGSGKSTLTLACLRSGLETLGDDYVWVEPGSPWSGHSLYSSVRLAERGFRNHFSDLCPHASAFGDEKFAMFVSDLRMGGMSPSFPIRGVAALRIGKRRRPTVRIASTMHVLTALAPSSLLQLPGSGASGLARLTRLIRESRALLFEAGSDYSANVEALTGLVEELSRSEERPSWSIGASP